jgi:hypothetical protein
MTRGEKILKDQKIIKYQKLFLEAMKEAAWQAWDFSCVAFFKLNRMKYGDKQKEIEKRAFEVFWNEEID